ncbi:MAG: HDIG domain-containing protein [Armatimonadetes bacterium]|nr:HDIG domain-containing protein [Armatimonadota bacterium]
MPLRARGRKKDSDKKNGKRRRIDTQRAGLAVATIVVLSVLLCIHLLPDRVPLVPGDVAPNDIRAHRPVRYLDVYETKRQQSEAASVVHKIYDRVPYALNESLRKLSSLFEIIVDVRADQLMGSSTEEAAHAREEVKNQLGIEVPFDALLTLVRAQEPVTSDVREVTVRLVRETMSNDLKDDVSEMRKAHTKVDSAARDALGNTKFAAAAAEIAKAIVRPNMISNYDKTAAERERAVAAVKPVYAYVRSGELIIAKGQRVTQEHMEKFTALGLRQRRIDYRTVISLSALVSFFVGLVIIYLARYQPVIYRNTRLLLMLSLVVVASTLGLKLGGGMLGIKLSGLQLAYIGMIFTTTAGMVLAALLNPQVAVLIVAMLSIVSGLVMNNELRYTTSTLVSALVAIYAVATIRGRADQLRAFAVIAVTNVAIMWIIGGLFGDSPGDMLIGSVWAVLIIAPAATTLFWYLTWVLERPFRVTTHISLLELADTNKPLLRRMVVEAPGTYTHSMAVGHLAEAAAESIGADSLFVRVAAYYHDIGKIRRPQFFVENQIMENVHDRLNPTLSALVITSHIKDGLEVAREFKLPLSIQEIIVQHHGTSLIQYFYNQASGRIEPSAAFEQQFRYDGPKPMSKEAAIVMLADSVEAASRSLPKPTVPALETLVRKIISDKVQDGQLNNSELTFRDIGVIEETFVRTLAGALHARVEYQNGISSDSEKIADDGNLDQELPAASGE